MDGAGYFKRLAFIVRRSISGSCCVALLIRSMDALRYFDIIGSTTNGGPADATKMIPIRLYEIAFRSSNLGYAAAIGHRRCWCCRSVAKHVPADPAGVGGWRDERQECRRPRASACRCCSCVASSCCGRSYPIVWMVLILDQAEPGPDRERRRRSASRRRWINYRALFSCGNDVAAVHRQLDLRRRASRRSSPSCSAALAATGSRARASAARSTSRSGSSPSGWCRSRRSCCRCS